MERIRIEQLEYLLEVARCQSISQGAKNLFIGQSTLSSAISSLEAELQVEIFRRTHKGLVVTPLGESVISEAEAIVERANNLKKLSNRVPFVKRNVHMVSYPAGSISVMVSVAEHVYQGYPDVQLHIHEMQPEQIVKGLLAVNGTIGVGALSSVRLNALKAEAVLYGFNCEILYVDRLNLYVEASDPLAKESTTTMAQIMDEPLALLGSWISPKDNIFYAEFQAFKNAYSFSSFEAIKRGIVKNKMMGISPTLAFYQDIYLEMGIISEVVISDFQERLINFMIYPKDEVALSSFEVSVIETIRAFYHGLS